MKNKQAGWSLSLLLTVMMAVVAGSALAAPGDTLLHNSNNLGTTYGNWGVVGGKYGEITCATCHNKTTANVKRIAANIIAPQGNWSSSKTNSVPVVFNNMSAFGNDADGHATSARICEVCHSKTAVHRYNASGQADLDHKGANGTDCTGCHSHADAFKGKGCTSCHGSYAGSGNTIVTGKHTKHIDNAGYLGLNYGCADCHAKTVTSDTDIKSAPTAHKNGTYGDYSGARAGGNYAAGNCTNVYCHTDGKGGAPAVAVNWSTGPAITDCKGCHGGGSQAGEPVYANGGINSVTANTHPKHVGTTGANATCQNCHGATMSGTAINTSGKHTDKSRDVLEGNGKTFTYSNDSSKTCSTVSCHSNGFFTPATVQWGATMPADCTGCHDNTGISSGNHSEHLTTSKVVGIGCVTCHANTVTNNTTLKGLPNSHLNAAKDVVFADGGGSDCTNVYCHSYGTKATGPYTVKIVPTWGATWTANCYSCHGSDKTTGTLNNMSTGRHKKHMVTYYSYGCAICHADTAANNTSIGDASKHINKQIDVKFSGVAGGFANYTKANKAPGQAGSVVETCRNIYCHSNAQTGNQAGTQLRFRNLTGVLRWGQTGTISGCSKCHTGASTTTGAWTLSGAHVAHIAYPFNAQIGKALVCNDCHANGGTSNSRANHANGLINYSAALSGSIARGNLKLSTGRCNTVYCHSNGQGVFNNMSTNNWFSGVNLGCNGCHGDAAAATSLSGKHDQHVNYVATGGSFSCAVCHASTATNSTTLTTLGKHVNAFKDVSGAKVNKTGFVPGNGTCTNTCHTDGKGVAAVTPLWTATGPASNLDCTGCHGGAGSQAGEPVYVSNNNHQIHVGTTAADNTCQNCHGVTMSGTALNASGRHLNAFINVTSGNSKTFSYVAATQTCSNISCHSSAGHFIAPNATWGTKATCATCHPKAGLSGAHQVHMGALDLTSASIYYNMTANRSPAQAESVARTYGFGCGECHPMDKANHLNGTVDVDLNRVNVAGVGTLRFLNHSTASYGMGTTSKCSNIYCHSNASRLEAESNVKDNTSLAWTDTYAAQLLLDPSYDRCAQCHGNQPTTGAHAAHAVSNHADNIYNGKNGKVGFKGTGNSAHGNPNTTTTITCYICHTDTVNANAHGNDKNDRCKGCHGSSAPLKGTIAINNLANHVNGKREIKFAAIKVRSKAQVRPESFLYYSGVWKRSYYKNMTSLAFDEAKAVLDTNTMWHPGSPTESSCSNLACHNGYIAKWNMANWNDPNKCMDCHFKL